MGFCHCETPSTTTVAEFESWKKGREKTEKKIIIIILLLEETNSIDFEFLFSFFQTERERENRDRDRALFVGFIIENGEREREMELCL